MQTHTRKGDVGTWRVRLGRWGGLCSPCRKGAVETGNHLVFEFWSVRVLGFGSVGSGRGESSWMRRRSGRMSLRLTRGLGSVTG